MGNPFVSYGGIAVDPDNGDLMILESGRTLQTPPQTSGIFRYNGSSWDSGFATPSTETNARGVTVAANGDILTVGASGLVYRYDGSSWDDGISIPSAETSPKGLSIDLETGDLLVVGSNNVVYRYDGSSWSGFLGPPEGRSCRYSSRREYSP